ncbi:MAG: hypothetical protein MK198_05550 [Gracilimonas sp.]|uniref:hypothetical protein n=1 Tax=Gracilimonas sp. TaxID=1974203 RepID=UPI003753B362|nr:hypothetical protein [Gracilimonas sp.]
MVKVERYAKDGIDSVAFTLSHESTIWPFEQLKKTTLWVLLWFNGRKTSPGIPDGVHLKITVLRPVSEVPAGSIPIDHIQLKDHRVFMQAVLS